MQEEATFTQIVQQKPWAELTIKQTNQLFFDSSVKAMITKLRPSVGISLQIMSLFLILFYDRLVYCLICLLRYLFRFHASLIFLFIQTLVFRATYPDGQLGEIRKIMGREGYIYDDFISCCVKSHELWIMWKFRIAILIR